MPHAWLCLAASTSARCLLLALLLREGQCERSAILTCGRPPWCDWLRPMASRAVLAAMPAMGPAAATSHMSLLFFNKLSKGVMPPKLPICTTQQQQHAMKSVTQRMPAHGIHRRLHVQHASCMQRMAAGAPAANSLGDHAPHTCEACKLLLPMLFHKRLPHAHSCV